MNFKLIKCGFGFHQKLSLAFKRGRETTTYHCEYCDTWIEKNHETKKNKTTKKD